MAAGDFFSWVTQMQSAIRGEGGSDVPCAGHRPKTCRTYDCRIFAATGVEIDDHDKRLISEQARRWEFDFLTQADRVEQDAVLAASSFLREHSHLLPDNTVPTNPTQLAVLAIEIHEAFLKRDEATGQMTRIDPDPETVRLRVMRWRQQHAC